MSATFYLVLADAVLLLHLCVILFNIFGIIVVPLGAWRGWKFVRVFWWRALHVGVLAVVALQAVMGRLCFLTIWHADLAQLADGRTSNMPGIAAFISRLIFWPLPAWAFVVLYIAVCIYTFALWRLVPLISPGSTRARALHPHR